MATIGNTYLTLADLYKRSDPKHQIAAIIEMLAQVNPILQDALAVECNLGTKHLTTVRTGLPSGTWRKLYQGVSPTKSHTAQVEDTTGMLEAWSEIDSKLVELAPDKAAFRLSESSAFIEGMSQDMATGLFYHDTATDPEKFMGLGPRFNSTTAPNGNQIVKAGGSGSDNTSIWFVVWGERTCHLLYPKGSKAGLQRDDKGMQTKTNSDGSILDVHREKFTWDLGLSVRDWRYVARICNIDVSELTKNAATGADLIDNMITAYYRLRQRKVAGGRLAIYCNTTVKEFLHKQATNKTNVNLRITEVDGQEMVSFLGAPIRECEAILNTEATVS